jgi:hypothetical protein
MSFGGRKHERRRRKFALQNGLCHWCAKPMTLDRGTSGRPVRNFATFEHLQRRRDGGVGKPHNVVLACYFCNYNREAGKQTSKPSPENIAARKASRDLLLERLRSGTLTAAERGELFTRGILPNWPMWSKMMAHIPPGNP